MLKVKRRRNGEMQPFFVNQPWGNSTLFFVNQPCCKRRNTPRHLDFFQMFNEFGVIIPAKTASDSFLAVNVDT